MLTCDHHRPILSPCIACRHHHQPESSRLHVYRNSVVEWVVAQSPEEAAELYRAYWAENGYPVDAITDDLDCVFTQEDDRKRMTIGEWKQGRVDSYTDQCKFLAMLNGKGFLCSTEW